MPWGAIIGGIVSGAGSALAGGAGGGGGSDEVGNQLKKGGRRLKQLSRALVEGEVLGLSPEDIFGTRPEFAQFEPIDLTEEQLARITGNTSVLPALRENVLATNRLNTETGELRFDQLVPRGTTALRNLGRSAESLSRGELPFDDVLDIVRNRAGLAQQLGLSGTQLGGALPRDLGLSRLQAIQAGSGLLAQASAIAESIDPVGRQITPQSMFLSPQTGVQVGLNQAILGQQSRQGQNLFDVAPDPLAQGIFNFEVMQNLARMGQATAAAGLGDSRSDLQNIGLALGQVGTGLSDLFAARNNPYNNPAGYASTTTTSSGGSGGNVFGSIGNAFSGAVRGIGSFLGGLF